MGIELIHSLVLGIVEGITEFLPISSTGHLIVAGALLGFNDEKGKVFEVAIQTGAILAVVWEYRERLLKVDFKLWTNLFIAFLPAAVLGLAFGKTIKAHLFHPVPVAIAFIVGAVIILLVERKERVASVPSSMAMTPLDAFKVGLAQCAALIPGTSRSAATIIGGMLFGLSRPAATEFSFYLAVPTLLAAGGYDVLKHRDLLSAADLPMFGVGLLAAYVSALLVIRWLVKYIATHDFKPFAYYRIAFGLLILLVWRP